MSCQQYELYSAEESIVRDLALPELTLGQAQAMADCVRELPWFADRFPNIRFIEMRKKHTNGSGSVGGLASDERIAICEMAPAHMNALFICHEISHPLCESRYGNGSHSPWFARTYLELVYQMLGPEAYKMLYDAFEAHGIDHEID